MMIPRVQDYMSTDLQTVRPEDSKTDLLRALQDLLAAEQPRERA